MDKYDKKSAASILEYAHRLTGRSLAQAVELPPGVASAKNKGSLGLLLEEYYFEHMPGSYSGPDFKEAGIELKVTGLLKSPKGGYRAKERLVLKMINYESIVDESWETSEFLKKCNRMLIMFYEYDAAIPLEHRRFVVSPVLYQIPDEDLSTIRHDWETIRNKVVNGKAHELSEGDTYLLGASRKGAGGEKEKLRKQPNSSAGAKSRAFSFSPAYLDKIIAGAMPSMQVRQSAPPASGTLMRQQRRPLPKSLSMRVTELLSRHLNLSVSEISEIVNLQKKGSYHKGFMRDLLVRLLASDGRSIADLEAAGIELKTIRLNAAGKPRESMSFPGFKYEAIVNQSWEESSFFERIERKFLFIVFAPDHEGTERFERFGFWNMPFEDRLEARRVWEVTRQRVIEGIYDFPRQSESRVAHVRPKARDSNDTYPTPQGGSHVKQAFWLNSGYIHSILEQL